MKQPFFLFLFSFFFTLEQKIKHIFLLLLLGAFIYVLFSPSSMLHMAREVCCYLFLIEKTEV